MRNEAADSNTDVFRLLALEDAELEAADLVRMTLAVARGIPYLPNLASLNRTWKGWSL